MFFRVPFGLAAGVLAAVAALEAGGTWREVPGWPKSVHYGGVELSTDRNIWTFTELRDGRLLAGGADLYAFDGRNWEAIPFGPAEIIKGLVEDREGRIWIGAAGEFGYMEGGGRLGVESYRSLVSMLPESERPAEDIWGVYLEEEGVFFVGQSKVYYWSENRMRVFSFPVRYRLVAQQLEGRLYLSDREGTMVWEGGGFRRIAAYSEGLSWQPMHLHYGAEGELRGISDDGVLVVRGEVWELEGRIWEGLGSSPDIIGGVEIGEGIHVVGALRGGLLVVDRSGVIVDVFPLGTVLPVGLVSGIYADRFGGVWVGGNEGVGRVDFGYPARVLVREEPAVYGRFTRFAAAGDDLFLGTTEDVLRFSRKRGEREPLFAPLSLDSVGGSHALNLSLVQHKDRLLMGGFEGLRVWEGEERVSIPTGMYNILHLAISRSHPDSVLMANRYELRRYSLEGSWSEVDRHEGVPDYASTLVENLDGSIWMGLWSKGVYRILPGTGGRFHGSELWTAVGEHRLDGGPSHFLRMGDEVVLFSRGRAFLWEPGTEAFRVLEVVDSSGRPLPSAEVLLAGEGLDPGTGWILAREVAAPSPRVGRMQLRDRKELIWDPLPTRSLRGIGVPVQLEEFRLGERRRLAIVASNTIQWLDLDGNWQREEALQPVLTWSGAGMGTRPADGRGPLAWREGEGRLEFRFFSPDLRNGADVRFQTRLGGLEREWEASRDEGYREFSGLRAGHYRFEVRAVNAMGGVSEVTEFAFRILPPWYRTAPAWAGYSLGLLLTMFAGFHFRARKLKRQSRILEQAVKDRTQELEKANRVKSDFVANMSHEIRNPMNGIIGGIQLLKPGSPLGEETLSSLRQRAFYLNRLVNNILDFSKIESGKVTTVLEEFDPMDLRDTIQLLFQDIAEKNNVSFVVDYRGASGLWIETDRSKVEQILMNLVSNALRFTPFGSVRVGLRLDVTEPGEGYFRLWVTDSGTGIAPEDQKRIFEPFEQGSSASPTGKGEKGTGLGLSIVRDIVRVLDGQISFSSELGRGTRFLIALPVRTVPEQQARTGTEDVRLSGNYLVTEDLDYNLRIFRSILESWGAKVWTASDGRSAFEHLAERKFDAIFLDWDLPDYNGIEIAQLIRKGLFPLNTDSPILAQTAYVGPEHERKSREAGMDEFLSKPITPEKLLEALSRICPGHLEQVKRDGFSVSSRRPGLDLEILRFMAKCSGEGLKAGLARYQGEFRELSEQLEKSIRDGCPAEAREWGHKLMGHLGLVHARPAMDFLEGVLEVARRGEKERLRAYLQGLRTQVDRVMSQLEAFGELEVEFLEGKPAQPDQIS